MDEIGTQAGVEVTPEIRAQARWGAVTYPSDSAVQHPLWRDSIQSTLTEYSHSLLLVACRLRGQSTASSALTVL